MDRRSTLIRLHEQFYSKWNKTDDMASFLRHSPPNSSRIWQPTHAIGDPFHHLSRNEIVSQNLTPINDNHLHIILLSPSPADFLLSGSRN